MLTENQCQLIEQELTGSVEPRKVGAYLCLHMGLMLSEVCALRWGEIDLTEGAVEIRQMAVKTDSGLAITAAELPRRLPMPPHVRRFLLRWAGLYPEGDCFIMTGSRELPAFYMMQNVLSAVNKRRGVAATLSAMDLRNAFIRRCIQSGMDLYTLCFYVGIRQPNVILKRFGEYFVPRPESVAVLEKYSQERQVPLSASEGTARMNLLILGAGGQGPVFFRQKRVGIHKTYFNIVKFRSMRQDTPHDMPTHLLNDPQRWITKTGRFLRKTSLDELPQIAQIFTGKMSIIGPRPALWNQYDLIAQRDQYGANDITPGLTGWAQVNGRDELEIEEKARLDGEYAQNISFGMDMKIFWMTVRNVLRGSGVVEGGPKEMKKESKS